MVILHRQSGWKLEGNSNKQFTHGQRQFPVFWATIRGDFTHPPAVFALFYQGGEDDDLRNCSKRVTGGVLSVRKR